MLVELVVPALLPEPSQGDLSQSALVAWMRGQGAPSLARWVARAETRPLAATTLEEWLCQAHGLVAGDTDLPLAALAVLGEQGQPGESFWLYADPVHMAPANHGLRLTPAAAFGLSRAEADELVSALNRHFADTALSFHALSAQRWYARLPTALDVRTTYLERAMRTLSAHALLPTGKGGAKLARFMNEAQMVLFAHPVNAAREARGLLPVNALWLSGGGRLPTVASHPYAQLYAEHPVALGLARATQTSALLLPAEAQRLLEAAGSGRRLVVLDALLPARLAGDAGKWRRQLESLESRWFAPLLTAWCKGGLDGLVLHAVGLDGGASLTLPPHARWRSLWGWWRKRPRPNGG